MLQLIGFLCCLYLVIKAFEISGNSAKLENGKVPTSSGIAIALCVLGAIGFGLAFYGQGEAMEAAIAPLEADISDLQTPYTKCLSAAGTSKEIDACNQYLGID